jgi:hypothetical protein
MSTNPKKRDGKALKKYNDEMLKLLKRPLPINERNELTPRVLEITPETKQVFYEFSDSIEERLKPGGDPGKLHERVKD